MKLTYENCDKLRLTNNGTLVMNYHIYVYGEACKTCGEPFIASRTSRNGKISVSKYCCRRCSILDRLPISDKTRAKMSKAQIDNPHPRFGRDNHMYGKPHTQESKDKMSRALKGRKLSPESIAKSAKSRIGVNAGKDNWNYRGHPLKVNVALYDTYGKQLAVFEEVRIYMLRIGCVVYKTLQVRCYESGCRKWFRPTLIQAKCRLQAFNGTITGQQNFYCGPECKINCSVFGRSLHFKGQKDIVRTYSTSDLHIWAREVLRRANFTCVICGEQANTSHHLKSKIEYPEFALDPTIGAAVCEKCHMSVFHTGKNHPTNYIDKCRKPKIILKN